MHDHMETVLLFDFLLQMLDLIFVMNMSLLDELIGGRYYVVMDLQHRGCGGDVMVKIVFISMFSFFKSVFQ